MRKVWIALLLAPLAAAASAPDRPFVLTQPVQLSPTAGAPAVAVLMSGASVQAHETVNGWTRITMEGWAPAEALASAAPAEGSAPSPEPAATASTPAASAPAVPAAATPPSASADAAGTVRGIAFITGKKSVTIPAARMAVRLLAEPPDRLEGLASMQSECAGKLESLDDRAAQLKEEAGRALRTTESASQAFQQVDALKAERRKVLAEIVSVDQDCQRREDEILEAHTAQRAVTDAEGRFAFDQVPAGRYTLQATFAAEEERHRWLIPVTVESGGRVTVDLTSVNRSSVAPAPQAP